MHAVCLHPEMPELLREKLIIWANNHNFPIFEELDAAWAAKMGFVLGWQEARLVLHSAGKIGAIYPDWHHHEVKDRIRMGLKQPIARACGLAKKPQTLLDATAGLGRDAWVLSQLALLNQNGDFKIELSERNPVLHFLLRHYVNHLNIHHINVLECQSAHQLLQNTSQNWDVIYLDPMYPHADKKTALPKKEMQILRNLVGADHDADDLLALARARANQRVVVKRPAHAPFLADCAPMISHESKQARFDVYWA